MTHLALYRAWRPMHFDEVVEQKHAVFALRQAVISDQIGHAYLFSGTRGTGKTTLAKIFSRAINCLNPEKGNPCNTCVICKGILDGSLMDVVEMDAASNNSVDNIRRICDEVVFMPSQAKYKVYIIDEVHMLSTGAFNALLKTLEEPPAHAVFILATTEPHRIPATILSRCQRYDFRRIPVDGMIGRLAEIAKADQIEISDDALRTIAMLADGAMRDAISLLDQARMRYIEAISRDDILALAGIVQDEFMILMAKAIHDGQPSALLDLIEQLIMDGRDLAHFVTDLAQFYRNLLVCRVSRKPQQLIRAPSDALKHMITLSRMGKPNEWVTMIQGLSALLSEIRWSSDARTTLEIGLIKLMDEQVLAKTALESEGTSVEPIDEAAPVSQTNETKPTEPIDETADESQSKKAAPVSQTNETKPTGPIDETAEESQSKKAAPVSQTNETKPAGPIDETADTKIDSENNSYSAAQNDWDAGFPEEPPPEDDSNYYPDAPLSEMDIKSSHRQTDAFASSKDRSKLPTALSSKQSAEFSKSGSDAAAESGSELESESTAETEIETKTETNAQADTEQAAKTKTEMSAQAETEQAAIVETKTNAKTEIEQSAEAKDESGPDPEDDAEHIPPVHIDPAEIWQQVSNQLQQNGHMTTYLFSRPASISASGLKLILTFKEAEAVHYEEIGKAESVKLIRQFASEAAGRQIAVDVQINGAQKLPEKKTVLSNNPAWIDTVTETAKELGIPVKMEE